MDKKLFAWKRKAVNKQGILCGADKSQEWLLPWWWSRYSEHNAYPVIFCDFGMSEEMRSWCAERGEVVSIEFDPAWIAPKSAIDKKLVEEWEDWWGERLWDARLSWFKKPFALLHSPYEVGIWIDLDCEILGPIERLFSGFDVSSGIAMVRNFECDHLPQFDPNVRHNGGVIVFKHGCSCLQSLAEESVNMNHLFGGDDTLLSHLISSRRWDIQELPEEFNWRMSHGLSLGAVIIHWVNNRGKDYIRKYGGLKPTLDAFYNSCNGN